MVFFENGRLKGTKFNGATLKNASFKYAYIEDAKFNEAKIDGADFSNAIIYHYSLSKNQKNRLRNIGKNELLNIGNSHLKEITGGSNTEIHIKLLREYKVDVFYSPKYSLSQKNEYGSVLWVLRNKSDKDLKFWMSSLDTIFYKMEKWYSIRKSRRVYTKKSHGNINMESKIEISDTTEIHRLLGND